VAEFSQSTLRNRLLKALSPGDFDLIRPHLRSMPTDNRQVMIRRHTPITTLFFVESGFTSVTTQGLSSAVEIGLIGPEGLVGAAPVMLGDDATPYDHFVQSPGDVLSIGTHDLCAAADASASLRRLLLRYVQTLLIQTAQTAFVNATFVIEVRLARWLLMCQDRLNGDEFELTHEFLSVMLGVQRTSVTLALQTLEGNGLIRARRGHIQVRDREQLRVLADDAYGVPEAEYERLIDGG
jgi:CRP-like cAMP-binding protein